MPSLMQCAAVISRSCRGLSTALAVQKWFPDAECAKMAPTRSALRNAVCALGTGAGTRGVPRHGRAAPQPLPGPVVHAAAQVPLRAVNGRRGTAAAHSGRQRPGDQHRRGQHGPRRSARTPYRK